MLSWPCLPTLASAQPDAKHTKLLLFLALQKPVFELSSPVILHFSIHLNVSGGSFQGQEHTQWLRIRKK